MEDKMTFYHFFKHSASIRIFEGELTVEHGIEDDTRAPGVDFRPIIGLVLDDLWGSVVWRTA